MSKLLKVKGKARHKQALLSTDRLLAQDAADFLRSNVVSQDLGFLIKAFGNLKDYLLRIDVVEMVGQIRSEEACAFLLRVRPKQVTLFSALLRV